MRALRGLSGLAVVFALLTGPAGAIIIRHDRDEAAHRELGAAYPAVGKVRPDGEATLIAPRWIVTAAHVAQGIRRRGGTVQFGDATYDVGKIFIHPDWRRGQHSDIALVKLASPVLGVEPVGLYDGRDEAGKIVTFVGRGDFGTGETGARDQDGVLRGATNRVEEANERWITFTFDPPGRGSTRLEGISGPGDSGGPALLEEDGKLVTLGVSSGGMSPPGGRPGTYGSRELYVRISSYIDWIRSVMEDGRDDAGEPAAPGRAAGADAATARERAQAFVALRDDLSDAAIRRFIDDHMARSGDRPPAEQRIAAIRGLFQRLGDFELLETRVGPHRADLVVQTPERPERIQLGFELEPDAPHLVDAIFMDILGDGDRRGGRAALPPPPMPEGGLTGSALASALGDYMDSLEREHGFSGVVLVARGGEPLFHEAYGLASRRYDAPNRRDTRFNVGSITKALTKVAVGQLLQEGRLSLEDTILDHIPDYPNRKAARRITVGHLLEHTSGLGDIFNERYAATPKQNLRTPRDFFPVFAAEPLRFQPGERREYSNAGYIVLGAIVEAVDGRPYDEVIRKRVFEPAGMSGSGFFPRDVPEPNLAEGYTRRGCPEDSDGPCRSSSYLLNFAGCPAGGSYSSAEDLLRFDRALREHRLLEARYTAWYLTGRLPDDPGREPARTALAIAGGGPGVSATLQSDGSSAIVVLANQDPPVTETLARHLERLVRLLERPRHGGVGG